MAYSKIQPQIVITTFVAKISEKNFTTIHTILEQFTRKSKVFVSGSQLRQFETHISGAIQHLLSIDQLNSELK
ncbi:MAG: hypothetical protein A3D92_13410 [Bacteroidetes bacterium RIFCSPHIGHO2_02_FULL_44_7]|nr:MAG: hypothetical protein A3D92_13410 [Bacteroidetes bacterium RIFCSPHIGHO2_02_FULL_44_7]